MKKARFFNVLLALSLCAISGGELFAQAKKPTMMVVPANNYCFQKGFMKEIDELGTKRKVPDFERAFLEDAELRSVVNAINNFMADREFPLKDLEQVMKISDESQIEEELVSDKKGNKLAESDLDRFKRRARADFVLDLSFRIERNGPEKRFILTLKGLDAYSGVQIAGEEFVGKPTMNASTGVILTEDNYTQMDNFFARLSKHFDDMVQNGRMVKLRVRLAEGAPVNFDQEFGDEEFSEILETWLAELSVNKRNGTIDVSDNEMTIEQIRIPLMNPEKPNQSYDARGFLQVFRKRLKKAPYNLECKVYPRGLGEAWLIIGGTE